MVNKLIDFLKKTYVVWIIIGVMVGFFLIYNTYLVDRSLSNLRNTLDRLDNVKTLEDAKKLARVLDFTLLSEIASKDANPASISKLEIARAILSKSTSVSQIEDAKFAIKEVIKEKEKERSNVLVALDKLSSVFVTPATTPVRTKFEVDVASLQEKLGVTNNRADLQEIYFLLGNAFTQLAQFSNANDAYQKAINLIPRSQLAMKCEFNLAWNDKLQGKLNEAMKKFEVIINKTAQNEEINIFSQYQIADILQKKGEFQKAIALYKQLASKHPTAGLSQTADFQIGNIYLYDLKQYEKAKQAFLESKEKFQGSSMASHIEDKKMPDVLLQYAKDGFKLLKEGNEFNLQDKYKEATRRFDKSLETYPEDGIAYIGKALAASFLKDNDKALEYARTAIRLMPNNEIVNVNTGYIYLGLGMIEEAISVYKRFLTVNPSSLYCAYNLGSAYIQENNFKEAISFFRLAVSINPKFPFSHNNLGWCYWQLNKYTESIEAFEDAIKIEPRFLDAIFNLGMVYETLGRYEESIKTFEGILAINPEFQDAIFHLGMVYKAIERYEEARVYFERVLRLNPIYYEADFHLKETTKILQERKVK